MLARFIAERETDDGFRSKTFVKVAKKNAFEVLKKDCLLFEIEKTSN